MQVKVSKSYLVAFAVKLLLLGVLLDATFRVVIPACETPVSVYDDEANILKFSVNDHRDGLYTFGSMAEIRGRWHVNNFGWISDCDYRAGAKPDVAIIGDSYVEGFHVNSDLSVGAILRRNIGGNREVYSFGISGASLSQYLQMSRYVRKNFDPEIMVFNIVDGDVLGSLAESGGRLYYSHDKSGVKEVLVPTPDSRVRELLTAIIRESALLRYVIFNCGFLIKEAPAVKAAPHPSMSEEDMRASLEVVSYTFGMIRQENPHRRIIIVLDAPRSDIYQNAVDKRLVVQPQINRLIESVSRSYGFNCVDLTEPMKSLYAKNGKKFNFDNNYHWNEYGHQIAADEIAKEITRSKLLVGNVKALSQW